MSLCIRLGVTVLKDKAVSCLLLKMYKFGIKRKYLIEYW